MQNKKSETFKNSSTLGESKKCPLYNRKPNQIQMYGMEFLLFKHLFLQLFEKRFRFSSFSFSSGKFSSKSSYTQPNLVLYLVKSYNFQAEFNCVPLKESGRFFSIKSQIKCFCGYYLLGMYTLLLFICFSFCFHSFGSD